MGQFSANLQRLDPYKNFKYRVKWDGRYVAGVQTVRALKGSSEVMEYREENDQSFSLKLLERTKHEPITMKYGVSLDSEFTNWANRLGNFSSGLGFKGSLRNLRKDIVLEVYNEAGHLTLTYKVHRCWVSEFQAMPALNTNANEVVIESIRLENDGWELGCGVTEPFEPSL